MLALSRCLQSPRLMKAITGLTPEEFSALKGVFSTSLYAQRHQKRRKRRPGGGRPHTLASPEEKLLFILFYIKTYPTFDLLAFFFGVNRSQPCRWVQALLPLLEQTLGRKMTLPLRQIHSVEEFLVAFPEVKEIWVDGTERPIRRPKDPQKQKANYSGRRKRHTKKNILLTDSKKRILYLGKTHEGRIHDKSAAEVEAIFDHLPPGITCWLDKGFEGVQKEYPHLNILCPRKNPKGKELTQKEKVENKRINRIRIKIEHAIGGVKRFNTVRETLRNTTEQLADQLMFVACGLWNYHLNQAA